MSDNSSNNKRLAKNTIMLYFRMIFLMVVTLYTSRVTLQVLGVDDFGIYNIVGGAVVLFSFLSTALNSACNRFFSVAVGNGSKEEVQKTFSTALVAHIYLTIVVAIILETVGLWFVVNKLNIPAGREDVVQIIYHIAVLSVCFNITRTPFNASIIAHEKMDFYAYTSIVEGILKLVIVWILLIIPFDKLISYSLLMMATIVIINVWYMWYCRTRFEGNRFIIKADKQYMREMLTFSGWSLFGGVADIGWQQGTNIILNMFYGVTLNAAMGITNQVRTAVYSFVGNLQSAANPQIIKAYASRDYLHFHTLIYAISKYSFYLMLFFAIPLIVNMDFILGLWLGTPPDHANSFTILILIFSTIGALGGPLWVSIQATGDVKNYNIIVSSILLLNLPVTYILFYNNLQPESMLVARIVICIIETLWAIWYANRKVNLSILMYMRDVVLPILLVTIVSAGVTFSLGLLFGDGWSKLFITGACGTLALIASIYLLGINQSERAVVNRFIKKRISK